MGEVVVGGCLGDSDHEVVEFQIVGNRRKTASKTSTLDMGRKDLGLLKELVNKATLESAFEGIRVHECWSLFNSYLLRVQEQAIPKCRKSKWCKRLAWLSKDFLLELR